MTVPAYDVVVIGAGPGGYVAAIRAAQLGMTAAVVEREHLGGICLNWGCIPTKALLRSAEVYRLISDAKAFGLQAANPSFDAGSIVQRSRAVSRQLNGGVSHLLKKNKIAIHWGSARITAPGTIEIAASTPLASGRTNPPPPADIKGTGTVTARHIIVATGARARAIPGLEPDGDRVWSYFEAMTPARIPKSLAIIGAGAIGVEFATIFRTFGADVTVVEMQSRILPAEDHEIAQLARSAFEKQGIRVLTGARVAGAETSTDGVALDLTLSDGRRETLVVERVISAAGVVGNIEGLGLEAAGVAVEKSVILTHGAGKTNVPGLYAIGDVAGPPMLAHKAEHEGVICVETIAGRAPHPLNKLRIPGCTYCHPQIASVGMTEDAAAAAGHRTRIGRFPFRANGKALAMGEAEGLVKTIFDADTGQLLGAHLIGAEVTELIQGFVIAMQLETTEAELMSAVFPHPTLSETMHESVLSAYGRAIHV